MKKRKLISTIELIDKLCSSRHRQAVAETMKIIGRSASAASPSPSPSPAPSPSPHGDRYHHQHNNHFHRAPSPSSPAATKRLPSSPPPDSGGTASLASTSSSPTKLTVDLSPPLIAMVVVVATALLLITYSRLISRYLLLFLRRYQRWRRRRRGRRRRSYLPNSPPSTNGGGGGDYLDSPPPLFDSPDGFHHIYAGGSPYGLNESVIKTIPISLYSSSFRKFPSPAAAAASRDCAVCLLEFEDGDYVRTLPICSHAFHVDCIDIWLRSHANCPLCRARIFLRRPEFVPLMAARIRPSLVDDTNLLLLRDHNNDIIISSPTISIAGRTDLQFQPGAITESPPQRSEITPCVEEEGIRDLNLEDRASAAGLGGGDGGVGGSSSSNNFIRLKRSYSFGFERSERMLVTEPATVSPWRSSRRSSAWSKRPSPFGSYLSNSKPRLFSSFRYYYRSGIKSPFFRRRSGGGGGFFPLSERFAAPHGGGSSRRSKSMTSPMYLRPSSVFSSSRLRCGDPEALISPDRYSHSRR